MNKNGIRIGRSDKGLPFVRVNIGQAALEIVTESHIGWLPILHGDRRSSGVFFHHDGGFRDQRGNGSHRRQGGEQQVFAEGCYGKVTKWLRNVRAEGVSRR
jgi:hypothetical protein